MRLELAFRLGLGIRLTGRRRPCRPCVFSARLVLSQDAVEQGGADSALPAGGLNEGGVVRLELLVRVPGSGRPPVGERQGLN
jgi:hypothetical protein